MRWLITALLFLLVLTVQNAAAPYLEVLGAVPDFRVIFLVQLALVLPQFEAAVWAWCMGLAADLTGQTPAGVLAFSYCLVAFAFTRMRSQIFSAHILTRLILVVLAGLFLRLVLLISGIIRGHPTRFLLFLSTAAADLLYTAAFALVLLPLFLVILRRVHADRRYD